MQLEAFNKLRPYVYHTTSALNLDRVGRTRTIESARRLIALEGGEADPRIRQRRREALRLDVDGRPVMIRDQAPLVPGAIAFENGWDLPRFVEHLNGFTFFWPGDAVRPIASGRSHFERYAGDGEALAVLRIPTHALIEHNRERTLRFTRVNSGSARAHGGKHAPRGGSTFHSVESFAFPARDVKEMVLEGWAVLPAGTEVAGGLDGPWRAL